MRLVSLLTLVAFSAVQAADPHWRRHQMADGFSAELPATPVDRILGPTDDGPLRVYEAFEPGGRSTKYSIFVNRPEQRGMFEPASIDAFLEAHTSSLVQSAEDGRLLRSARLLFVGQPAVEYEFAHSISGQPYVGRGVTFAIDGGHVRLSMWHPASDQGAASRFRRFRNSFALAPIAYRPASKAFRDDSRGISFTPPAGWIQKPAQDQIQIARFGNLTRSLQVLAAGTPEYTCASLRAELQAAGRIESSSEVALAGKPFTRIVSFEHVPKYNVRLKTVHYCINSRLGAVVFGASEEQSNFQRWSKVFEGAAATLRLR